MVPIPISFLGTSLQAKESQIKALLAIDPVLFQGCYPQSATWMWFSVMETPESNGTKFLPPDQQVWKVQMCLSWPKESDSDIPRRDYDRILKMREKSRDFHPCIRALFTDVLSDDHRPIMAIKLQDWHLPSESPSQNWVGRVTLTGDAVHTMAMCEFSKFPDHEDSTIQLLLLTKIQSPDRGEGFNHSILDGFALASAIESLYHAPMPTRYTVFTRLREQVISDYEAEVRKREKSAVPRCRQDCLEVHQWDTLSEYSVVRQKTNL